uniref:Uncharacterized protein n=1 Tax=Globisporangium ultimum (strain ATCC 200006 / CBS 805.95 / DAOM BR144) TaxID=431595 RepID=K3WL63_GLOUD
MSASAVRVSTVANATQGQGPDPNTSASNIDAHWKKLEKEYSMENSSFPHSSTNGKPSSRTLARPQSARATSHRAAHSRQSRNQHDADTLLFTTDRGGGEFSGEDEDYGVVDDDDPSDEEDEDLENDDFADLLLRRDEKQQIRQQAQDERQEDAEERADKEPLAPGRGHRHRQALNESQRKSAFGAEQSLDKDGHMPRFSALGADESDLPNQRVSHMEYLRRMKRLAENMNDDLTGRSPSITAPPSSKSKNTQSTPQRSKPPTLISTANTPKPAAEDQDSPILTTPRGTSKIRERLERMR